MQHKTRRAIRKGNAAAAVAPAAHARSLARRAPPPPQVSFWESIFNWTQPFSGAVWIVLFSSFAFAALIFVRLETDKLGSMFQTEREHWLFSLWSGFHFGIRAFSQSGYFEPVTAAGIAFSMSFTFSMLLAAAACARCVALPETESPACSCRRRIDTAHAACGRRC